MAVGVGTLSIACGITFVTQSCVVTTDAAVAALPRVLYGKTRGNHLVMPTVVFSCLFFVCEVATYGVDDSMPSTA